MNGVDPAYQSLPGGGLTKKLEKVMDKKIAEALDGVSAKSAYQSYVDTTTDNPPKTEAEWVASLKGEDGVSLGEVAIADNLTTDDGTKVLSARQGYILGQKVNDVDNVPTAGSEKFVKSGGVQNELALGAIYDVSVKNPTAGQNNDGKFESLSALLSDANLNTLIPTAYRKGGMSIKFVQSSDNKYVQYRYMGTATTGSPNPFLDTANWQGVDDEPTAGSDNLVKSGGVYQELAPITNAIDALGWKYAYAFDKTKPSYATLNTPIRLSQEGDSFEFYVTNVPSTQNLTEGGYSFAGKNASPGGNIGLSYGASVYVRADDNTWILQYSNGPAGSTKRVKIVYNSASIDFYVDGTKVSTYGSLVPITIYSFGNANNTTNFGYWSGNIEELKINGVEVDLGSIATLTNVEDIGNHSFLQSSDLINNLESDSTEKALAAAQGKELKGLIESSGKYNEFIEALGGWKYIFNGTSSKITLQDEIVLQGNGDYIEIGISDIQSPSLSSGGYGFCVKGTNIRIGLSTGSLYVRADDDTWLFQKPHDFSACTIRISYESGNVLLKVDGTTIGTYSGQKKMTIAAFGYGTPSYGYWKGAISYIEANGQAVDISAQNNTDIVFTRDNAFLTDEQVELLSQSGSEMYVSKSTTQLDIYTKLPNGKYIHYPFQYRQKNYTSGEYPSFYDNWGISSLYLSTFSGSMSDDAALYVSGEAELAVSVPSGGDNTTPTYVGGQAHGFENIVTGDNGREISILVDNQKIAETDVLALTPSSKVEVVQHTRICQAYTNTNPFLDVTKHWVWENGKMSCTTSTIILRSILFRYAQFGMMCVYRRWLGSTGNDYLTNAAIKNNLPYKIWDVSDGWSGMLQSPDKNCTRIVEYGQKGLGFSMSIQSQTTKESGGMFVATNGLAYNKIYFDMGRSFTPSVNDVLEATQIWEIF